MVRRRNRADVFGGDGNWRSMQTQRRTPTARATEGWTISLDDVAAVHCCCTLGRCSTAVPVVFHSSEPTTATTDDRSTAMTATSNNSNNAIATTDGVRCSDLVDRTRPLPELCQLVWLCQRKLLDVFWQPKVPCPAISKAHRDSP